MKKTIRLTESELVHVIKKIISEQWGSTDPKGKCDVPKTTKNPMDGGDGSASPQDYAAEKSIAFNMYLDRNGDKLDKKQVYNDYKEFISTNKNLLIGGTTKPEENYAVASKALWYANNYPDSSFSTSLSKKFNNPNIENATLNDIIGYARQLGWDKFVKWYLAGGPEL